MYHYGLPRGALPGKLLKAGYDLDMGKFWGLR